MHPQNRGYHENCCKELLEEGSDAFRGVLEKLLNTAMQMEREEFLGARRWERSEQQTTPTGTRPRRCQEWDFQIRIPQVVTIPDPWSEGAAQSPEAGHRRDKVRDGLSTRKVTEITEQLLRSPPARSQESPSCWTTNSSSFATALWAAIQLCTWMPTTRR